MKKKLVSATLALLMGAVALTGCNTVTTEEAGEATGSAAPAAEGAAAEGSSADSMKGNGDKTINVFLYMQEHEKEIYKGLVEEFVEEHKDEIKEVVFEITTQDEYNTKMIANMTANDMPDVFYVGPAGVRSFVDNGYILPLDDYVDAETILPKDLSCFAFAYNKDLFDEAGLAYPDPEKPYTYDEFIEVCKALTKDKDGDGEIDQWGVANANQFGMTPYLYSNGVKFLNDDMTKVNVANNEALKNALKFYTDLTLNGLTPSVDQDTALGGYQRWLDGQIGFYACGTWDIAAFMDDSTFPYEWDLTGWPIGPDGDGRSHTWMGSVGYCISKNTENPDLCAELIAKLSTDEDGQKAVSGITTGSSIQLPNISDLAYGEFLTAVKEGKLPFPESVRVLFGYFEGDDHYAAALQETDYTYNGEWFDPFWQGVQNIQRGNMTVEDFLTQVEPDMQSALDNAIELQNSAKN